MKTFLIILALLIVSSFSFAQTINFTLADPQPNLVDIYSGSSDSGDIDGDGDNDLIMTGITPATRTRLYLNDGSGNFTEVQNIPMPNVYGGNTIFEDLDGDGDLDLFFSGRAGIQEVTHIYLNDGLGEFTLRTNPSIPQFSDSGVDIEDVDGDGDNDLLIAVEDENGVFLADVFLNNGNALFTPSGNTGITPVLRGAVEFIDVENDGDVDVIISGEEANGTSSVRLYLNDGTGNYMENLNSNFVQLFADDIDVADLDNDGDTDILMSGSTNTNIVKTILYTNNGQGQFTELTSSNLQNTFAGTNAIADLDNDGDQDIVIIGSQDGGLPNIYNIVYENLGNNVFLPVDTVGGEYIAACVVDDFTGDGLADIIIQGFADNTNAYWNTTSLSTAVDELTIVPSSLNIFPNPSSGELTIALEKEIPALNIVVFTIDGRQVYEQADASGTRIELQLNLQAGAYIVLLRSNNSIVARELLIMK